jgi:hypothetical protein
MPNVSKNKARPSQLEQDDKPAETTTHATVKPIKIVSMAIDQKGSFYGLGEDGSIYRLTSNKWEVLQ